jgi:integrase
MNIKNKRLSSLIDEYYLSFDFKSLRDETKVQYQYFLGVVLDTKIGDAQKLGSINFSDITTKMAKISYEQWCERGIHLANHVMSVARVVYNYGIHMEHCTINPFSSIKRRTPIARKVVWSRNDVKAYLDVAYSDFYTRSLGLIVHMAYEWCQRLGDMRVIKWSNLDLVEKKMHIQQSKRRAEVFLPIEDGLCKMLIQQEQDFGFQEYVAPRPRPRRGIHLPYTITKLPVEGRKIMDSAGLSKELRLSDLRRTGTTEMVDAGVSMGNIMSVTGHTNPQSVKPYMKNTFASANLALSTRKKLTHC